MPRRGRSGTAREHKVRDVLLSEDWWVCRAAGSLGDADLVALRDGNSPRLVEVKSTAQGPYEHFGPSDRADLKRAAEIAGCEAWLAWWPPRGQLRWISAAEWPA